MKLNLSVFLLSQAFILGHARDSIDVCVSSSERVGIFTPDPNKYYTIRGSVTNQPWVMEDNTNSLASDTPFGILTKGDPGSEADEKAHWRFIHQEGNSWVVQNRFNGMHVSLNPEPSTIGTGVSGVAEKSKLARGKPNAPGRALAWNFQCTTDLARVTIHSMPPEIFTTAGSSCTSCSIYPRDGKHISMGPRTTVETIDSGCVPLSSTCSSRFGSRFRQVSKDGCGLFADRLICRAETPIDHNVFLPEEWTIEEVTVFSKRGPNPLEIPPVVVADFRKPSVVANVLALGSDLVIAGIEFAAGTSILGALGGSLVAWTIRESLAPELDVAEQEREQLQANIIKLAEDLTEQTEKMINADLASEGLRETKNRINRRREWYLTGYPDQKEVDIAKPNNLKTLAAILKTQSAEYDNDIFAYYGDEAQRFDVDTTSDEDALAITTRATIGFDFLSLAVMDNLYMLQEAMLLDTFADSNIDCTQQVFSTFNMDFFVEDYHELLVATQKLLIDFQAERECCTLSSGNVFDGATLILPRSTDPSDPNSSGPIENYKQEIEHDVKYLSFNIEPMVAFFDSYLANSVTMCENLRTDTDSARALFAANQFGLVV